MAKAMGFDTVEELWQEYPDMEEATKREQRAEAAEKRRKKGVSAPRTNGPRPH